jgi:hypothetical protein
LFSLTLGLGRPEVQSFLIPCSGGWEATSDRTTLTSHGIVNAVIILIVFDILSFENAMLSVYSTRVIHSQQIGSSSKGKG